MSNPSQNRQQSRSHYVAWKGGARGGEGGCGEEWGDTKKQVQTVKIHIRQPQYKSRCHKIQVPPQIQGTWHYFVFWRQRLSVEIGSPLGKSVHIPHCILHATELCITQGCVLRTCTINTWPSLNKLLIGGAANNRGEYKQ